MTNNTLAFIALCNEYCAELEHCREAEPQTFVGRMLDLLPRIYITARCLQPDAAAVADNTAIIPALDEETYDRIRHSIELVMGEHDTFLETFVSDMKYSDEPICANVSESLADIFQVLFNFIETVRDAAAETIEDAVASIKDDFELYWSQTICNVMRPLNSIYQNGFDQ